MAPFKLKLSSERPIYFVFGQLTEVLKGVGRQVYEVSVFFFFCVFWYYHFFLTAGISCKFSYCQFLN